MKHNNKSKPGRRNKKKGEPRWHPTSHTGIRVDKDGNLKVRAAVKRNGKVKELNRVLASPARIGDALRIYAELKAELQGTSTRRLPTTVADFSERWIREKSSRVRDAVAGRYLDTLATHVLPCIGHVYVHELGRQQIVDMLDGWSAKTLPDGEPNIVRCPDPAAAAQMK